MSLADQILKRTDAVQQVAYLQAQLAEEAERRKRFRKWVREDMKAEFILGEIVLHSPVMKRHWAANTLLSQLLSVYVVEKELGLIGIEKVMIALTRNDFEPDLVFFDNEQMASFEEDQLLFPAPRFVAEILSKSTAKNHRTVKKEDYALHGVEEYWIVDPKKETVEQYLLTPDQVYAEAEIRTLDERIQSSAIAGLDIPVAAIFNKEVNREVARSLLVG